MLYIIGLGLSTIEDITISGLNAIQECDYVFIDAYTSILTHGIERISAFCGKDVKRADREFTEQGSLITSLAKSENVAFLVVGDPLCATTHTDLIIRAIKERTPYKIIHNSSIMTAVACCGLQLYRMGETVSIPLWTECCCPESFYAKIIFNYSRGLHTLCLLDIKVREKSLENLLHDRDIYEPPRFMLCPEAACQILEAGRRIRQRFMAASMDPGAEVSYEPKPERYLHPDCLVVCLARVGSPTQAILATTMGILAAAASSGDSDILSHILGGPLHSMIIPGKLHPMEIEFLSARLLIGDGKVDLENVPNGTSLPVLLPPTMAGFDFRERVKSMFDRHQELLSTIA
ncbi:unnamed protein product [Hydatigera taeniaeformis]|uniref:diphthine methyl ester synthase n=1 Tax=Hydatigena taeniaeformis TaxID=6205 RepID=A0A0R3X9V2_HYDTA|nr:unnamed protein product [Hydatigera taeniaeformis]